MMPVRNLPVCALYHIDRGCLRQRQIFSRNDNFKHRRISKQVRYKLGMESRKSAFRYAKAACGGGPIFYIASHSYRIWVKSEKDMRSLDRASVRSRTECQHGIV